MERYFKIILEDIFINNMSQKGVKTFIWLGEKKLKVLPITNSTRYKYQVQLTLHRHYTDRKNILKAFIIFNHQMQNLQQRSSANAVICCSCISLHCSVMHSPLAIVVHKKYAWVHSTLRPIFLNYYTMIGN